MRTKKIIEIKDISVFKENLLSWAQKFKVVFWLDSNSSSKDFNEKYSSFDALIAIDVEQKLECSYENAFQKLKIFRKETNDYIFGYLSYDLKNDLENLESNNSDRLGFADLFFFQPKKILMLKGNHVTALYPEQIQDEAENDIRTIIDLKSGTKILPTSKKLQINNRISKVSYFKKVESILEHIHRGDIYEVNFCQEFYSENSKIEPLNVYRKLNRISSPPFANFIKNEDQFLLSASPERFVKKTGNKIISQPIKGTARRLKDPEKDRLLAKNLASDPKERAENIMIVDLVRNDLSRSAIKGSVQVEELCKVYTFQQVHQLISTVSSQVSRQTDVIDIIKSLFPMGSMTGAPKISAMEIIEEFEETKRGLYSGAVGYFSPDDDFDFNVVIRSILYNKTNGYISFTVGGAITSKSVINSEYEECLIKARAMKKALED